MKRIAAARYRFSPSDLINYVRSEFITWMDRFYVDHPGEAEPDPDSEEMQIVQDKGIEHELNFVAALTRVLKKSLDHPEFDLCILASR